MQSIYGGLGWQACLQDIDQGIGGTNMEPVQRKAREITYRVGWKRGTMVHPAGRPIGNPASIQLPWVHRLNIASIWSHAGTAPIRVLLMGLWVFPVVIFIGSLWLVQMLTK
ncbi:hypothetical protein [Paenibacillus agricola]|nr:hypothetical protein [Paenibacillus agricola]